MPFDSATYCDVTNKIYASMGPYVVQCNATTGAREAIVKVASPFLGPTRLIYYQPNGLLYLSLMVDPAGFDPVGLVAPGDIWPIDPVTLLVAPKVNLSSVVFPGQLTSINGFAAGPRALMVQSIGVGFLYFVWQHAPSANSFWQLYGFDPGNPATSGVTDSHASGLFWTEEQFCCDGTFIYFGDPDAQIMGAIPINFSGYFGSWFQCDFNQAPLNMAADLNRQRPVACEIAIDGINRAFLVCGNQYLLNPFHTSAWGGPPGDSDFNMYDLSNGAVVTGAIAGIQPFRLRYRKSGGDHKIYIPCQNKDCVIVFNPATNTGVVKTGFDSPIDVVFTDTIFPGKAFAVQSGPTGLKEIV